MKYKINISKEILFQKYIKEKKSSYRIAREMNVCKSTILERLKKFHIPIRSHSEAIKLSHLFYPKEAYRKMSETKKRLYKEGELIPPVKDPKTAKKISKIMKSLWQNPEYRRYQLKAVMNNLYLHFKVVSPNKQEQKLIKLIQENKLPYNFVGNGKVRIGKLYPDFINTNNQRKVIELFGDYWHTKKVRCYEETEKGRIEYFKKHGFKCLVIWENELKRLNNVLQRIRKFDGMDNCLVI